MASNTLKIAVCLYGQPRTAIYCIPWIKKTFESLKGITTNSFFPVIDQQLIYKDQVEYNKVQVDYFLHLKNYNIYTNTSGDDSNFQLLVDDSEIKEIINEINPVSYKISTYDEEKELLVASPRSSFSAMFSSINTALNLKKKHQLRTGQQYDLVALHRYDSLLGPDPTSLRTVLESTGLQPLTVISPGWVGRWKWEDARLASNDVFLIGDDLAIDTAMADVTRMYATDNKIFGQHDFFNHGPNVALQESFEKTSIRHVCSTEFYPAVVRHTSDLSLPVFDNWAYHNSYWLTNHKSNNNGRKK